MLEATQIGLKGSPTKVKETWVKKIEKMSSEIMHLMIQRLKKSLSISLADIVVEGDAHTFMEKLSNRIKSNKKI